MCSDKAPHKTKITELTLMRGFVQESEF